MLMIFSTVPGMTYVLAKYYMVISQSDQTCTSVSHFSLSMLDA